MATLPTTVGKHDLGTVTIEQLTPLGETGKVLLITLTGGGKVKCWASAVGNFPVAIAENASAQMTVETKTNEYNGETRLEHWVTAFGGEAARKTGGGGKSYQPKTSAEIHSPSICGLIKSAIETRGDQWENVAARAIAIYKSAVDGFASTNAATPKTEPKPAPVTAPAEAAPQVVVEVPDWWLKIGGNLESFLVLKSKDDYVGMCKKAKAAGCRTADDVLQFINVGDYDPFEDIP